MPRFGLIILILLVLSLSHLQADEIIATIDGVPIYLEDLGIKSEMIKLMQQEHDLKKKALDELIANRLLNKEAESRGITVNRLLKAVIESTVRDPTIKEVQKLYNAQKTRINKPFEEVSNELTKILRNNMEQIALKRFITNLKDKSDIEYKLDQPRFPVELTTMPLRGPEDAPVLIVEFSDYECPYCRRVQPTMKKLREKYKDQLRWGFKDLPLVKIHPEATRAAIAARCAGDQNKFWDYRDALFEAKKLTGDLYPGLAEQLNLDTETFMSCLETKKYQANVNEDSAEAAELGFTGTPSFLVNGIALVGALPISAFESVIDLELKTLASASQPQPDQAITPDVENPL